MEIQHVSAPQESLESRLLAAIDVGASDSVRELLALGADPNCYTSGMSLRNTRKLSESMGGQEVGKCPALVLAALQGAESGVQLLIDAGANVDAAVELESTRMPAMVAAIGFDSDGSHEETVRVLVNGGADTRNVALLVAIQHAGGRSAELLLDHPQKQEVLDGALIQLGSLYFTRNAEFVVRLANKLIDVGADVNARAVDASGQQTSPLHSAAQSPCGDLTRTLIKRGARVAGAEGVEAMKLACKYGQDSSCIRVLAEHGIVPTPEMLSSAANAFMLQKVDDKLRAIMEAMHGAGMDPRAVKLTENGAKVGSIVEFVLRNDFADSARFIFEALGEDPYGLTEGGAPLARIAGTATKEIIMSSRMVSSVVAGVGAPAAEPRSQVRSSMGVL